MTKKTIEKIEKHPQKYPSIKIAKTKTGKGLVALEDIKKGRRIVQYIGIKITNELAEEKPNRYIFDYSDTHSLDGSPTWNTARYVNHGCAGNAESVQEINDNIFICAKRNIKNGEEITFDYGKEYTEEFFKTGCKCSKCSAASSKQSYTRK